MMARVRVEIMGSQKFRSTGRSQTIRIMINPIIFPRTRMCVSTEGEAIVTDS